MCVFVGQHAFCGIVCCLFVGVHVCVFVEEHTGSLPYQVV